MNLRTIYDPPPIPERQFDWQCYDEDSYDGAEDAGALAHCLGFGLTEQAAIDNWYSQWCELRNDAVVDEWERRETAHEKHMDDAKDDDYGTY